MFTHGIAVAAAQPEIRKRYNASNQPYASRAEVFLDNDESEFYLGQTFFLSDGAGGIHEYWFESATATADDLVRKNPESVKIVDSLAALRALDDLKLGDYVRTYGYHAGSDLGGGLFKVTTDKTTEYLELDRTVPNKISIPPTLIDIAQTFSIKFKLNDPSQLDLNAKNIMSTLASGSKFSFHVRKFVSGVSFEISTGNCHVLSVKDDFGNNQNITDPLLFHKWYEVRIRPNAAANFTSNWAIGDLFLDPVTVDVEWFEMMGERFELDEGSGTTITGSNGTVGTLSGNPAWETKTADDDNALYIETNNGIVLSKQVSENTVTPFDYGAIATESVTDFSSDSTVAIQSAINSGYNVEIPPSRLYITAPIVVSNPVHIHMHGSFMPMRDDTNSSIVDEKNETTILYSDQNIDYLVIRAHNVKVYNGLLYTVGSVDHDKSAVRFDLNYRMWRSDIIGVGVYGNESYLLDANKVGTIAFKIDGENLNPNMTGYLTEAKIDGRAYYCHKAVHAPTLDPGYGTFVNNIEFTVTGDGCQAYYDFDYGDLFKVESVCQDRPVLISGTEMDEINTAFKFKNCRTCTLDVSLADANKGGGVNLHGSNLVAISGENITVRGKLLELYRSSGIELFGAECLNRHAIVADPIGLVITSQSGFISQFDNAVAFAGTEGHVSYKGYKASSAAWFDGSNQFPADDAQNATTLSESTDVTIQNGEQLLTANPTARELTGHSIANVADRDLHFAEIVIKDLDTMQQFGSSDLAQVLLKIAGEYINSIQCVLHFSGGIDTVDITAYPGEGLYNLFGYLKTTHSGSHIQMIVIRMIGQHGDGTSYTYVRDVAVETQYARNRAYIHIGGDQTVYGQHSVAETFTADEYGYSDKSSGGFAGRVLQVKKASEGAVGLYNLNTNDVVNDGSNGSIVHLLKDQPSIALCQTTALTEDITPENATIDAIYKLTNLGAVGMEYTTELFANGVKESEVKKKIRGASKIESISFPVDTPHPQGTLFTFKVTAHGDGAQISGTSFTSKLRVTKSFLVPKPGSDVNNSPGTTIAQNATAINDLLQSLRNAGFIA